MTQPRLAAGLLVLLALAPVLQSCMTDASDRQLTRRIVAFRCDRQRNGWMGRQLRAMAAGCGLLDVSVAPFTAVIADWQAADRLFDLRGSMGQALAEDVISPAEATAWLADLADRAASGRFFSALSGFTVGGRKA